MTRNHTKTKKKTQKVEKKKKKSQKKKERKTIFKNSDWFLIFFQFWPIFDRFDGPNCFWQWSKPERTEVDGWTGRTVRSNPILKSLLRSKLKSYVSNAKIEEFKFKFDKNTKEIFNVLFFKKEIVNWP